MMFPFQEDCSIYCESCYRKVWGDHPLGAETLVPQIIQFILSPDNTYLNSVNQLSGMSASANYNKNTTSKPTDTVNSLYSQMTYGCFDPSNSISAEEEISIMRAIVERQTATAKRDLNQRGASTNGHHVQASSSCNENSLLQISSIMRKALDILDEDEITHSVAFVADLTAESNHASSSSINEGQQQ